MSVQKFIIEQNKHIKKKAILKYRRLIALEDIEKIY